MPPATQPFDAPARAGEAVSVPVAASTILYAGTLGGINAAGNAVPAADAANLRGIGRVAETVDNSGGSAGDKAVVLQRGVYRWKNSASDAATVAHLGGPVYVEDDTTISSAPGDHGVIAGELVALDGGAWVDTRLAGAHRAAQDALADALAADGA